MDDNAPPYASPPPKSRMSRRAILGGAGAAGLAGSLGIVGTRAFGQSSAPKTVSLAWTQGAACHSPLAFGVANGFFTKRGVNVALYNQGDIGQTLIQALATDKADIGIGLLLDWLKPLEQGFDVKLVSGTHGGCQRIITTVASGITQVSQLKGKTIAVAEIAGPSKLAFSVTLARSGIDPDRDVTWRAYPGELLAAVLQRKDADAMAHLDPQAFAFSRQRGFQEIANTETGVYQNRVCCVIGANGHLLRTDKDTVRRVVEGVIDIHEYAANHPDQVAKYYIDTYHPPGIKLADLTALLGQLTYHHHPAGEALIEEIKLSYDDMKLIKVVRPHVNSEKLAREVSANVFV
jgi:NitT/TauT family transport system substrate-binding protein